MRDFALPLPMAVIGELVGVPADDRSELQPLVRAAARGIEPMLADDEVEESMAAIAGLGAYFEHLLAERRRRPTDDLLSALGQAHENDDRLTDDEVLSTAILLFAAGFETTTNLLGNGLLGLAPPSGPTGGVACTIPPSPPRRSRSVRCASTAPSRVQPADGASSRPSWWAKPIALGDRIVVLQGAANRTTRNRFPDHPRAARPGSPGRQHPAQLRLGHPPLHRSPSGQDGRGDRLQCAARTLPRHRAHRGVEPPWRPGFHSAWPARAALAPVNWLTAPRR